MRKRLKNREKKCGTVKVKVNKEMRKQGEKNVRRESRRDTKRNKEEPKIKITYARFGVLTVVLLKIRDFTYVTPCDHEAQGTTGTTGPATRRHIPEDSNPQEQLRFYIM
jgi:hypothetical protein